MAQPAVKCPVCGEMNPADLEFCQNCQSRLQPLTGSLKGENAPIQPGQAPTKKVTSELEPILPQWLRDARQQARRSAEEEASRKAEEDQKAATQGPDLLAGLASQQESENEDVPDWLTSITGSPAKKKKAGPEDAQSKFVELGHQETGQLGDAAQASGVPSWMAGQEAQPEKDELSDWFAQTAAPAPSTADITQPVKPVQTPPAAQETDAGVADWLKSLDSAAPAQVQPPAARPPAPSADVPDWLVSLDSKQPAAGPAPAEELPATAPLPQRNIPPASEPITSPAATPSWLQGLGSESTSAQPPASETGLPDWLKAAKPFETGPLKGPAEPAAEEAAVSGEMPDWLSSLKPEEALPLDQGQAFTPEPPAVTPQESTPSPAFTQDAISGMDVDAAFGSMQLPDWLSSATGEGTTAAEENLPLPTQPKEEAIAPAELPSWVQAMRPVESAMPEAEAGPRDTTTETSGPLAGLQGVLPVIPGVVNPSSKPKALSVKLSATDEQQAQAALLEQILQAETSPSPMKAASVVTSQRILRWLLTAVVLLSVGFVVLSGTQIFPLPDTVPNETNLAMQTVNAIPENSTVLVVFDYEPSTIGEMEASGSSLMDNLLLLKHPHLALISTSPTGPAMAEHFMSTTLSARGYLAGQQYVDLGYLPGGIAGIYNFSQNPPGAIPLGEDLTAAWQSPILQGVTRLSDFSAVIVLTDRADSGRAWIEQTSLTRGKSPLIMVSSAQAGPMLLPYVDSGQVMGLVAGLNGAAGVEQMNNGLPGFIRRYWDAYSAGLLLAVFLIIIGGLWNTVAGLRSRKAPGVK